MRCLLALENITRKNRGLLSSLATTHQLHASLVSALQHLGEDESETTKLCLVLINRLIKK